MRAASDLSPLSNLARGVLLLVELQMMTQTEWRVVGRTVEECEDEW